VKSLKAEIILPDIVIKPLKPIFDLVKDEWHDGHPGAVFCQLDEYGYLKVVFIPEEAAKLVKEITQPINDKAEWVEKI